jgi:hypothetical protein
MRGVQIKDNAGNLTAKVMKVALWEGSSDHDQDLGWDGLGFSHGGGDRI